MGAGKRKSTHRDRHRDDQHAQHRTELHGPTPCAVRMSCACAAPAGAHTICHDNGRPVTQSSQRAQKVIGGLGQAVALRYDDVGIHIGNASVRSTHSTGADPAFPEPITPPTMAHVVSTSPPT